MVQIRHVLATALEHQGIGGVGQRPPVDLDTTLLLRDQGQGRRDETQYDDRRSGRDAASSAAVDYPMYYPELCI